MMEAFAQVTFDPSISLGSVFAALSIVVTIMATAFSVVRKMASHEVKLDGVVKDVAEMKPNVALVLVHQQQFTDGARRMDRIEDELAELRKRMK